MSPERETLWARLEKTSFLTLNEKRTAAGYGPLRGGDALKRATLPRAKFNPYHDELGRFTTGDGAADEDAEGSDGTNTDSDDGRRYSVNLNEEEARGGHAIGHHVNKSDEYLLGVVTRAKLRGLFVTIARIAEGSFESLEAANDFTNRVLQTHQADVDLVASGAKGDAWLEDRFGYATGKEAYRPSADAEPYIRPTYKAGVYIKHEPRTERGYRVQTAYPLNDYPKGR